MPLRPYDQEQIFLLPPSLNEWVREDHPARVFSEIIDRIDTAVQGAEGRRASCLSSEDDVKSASVGIRKGYPFKQKD